MTRELLSSVRLDDAAPHPASPSSLIALLHAAFFIVYQRPDWEVAWSDQGGYQQLGAGLAKSGGEFTRYPDSPTFIPEVIRTPGYPAFVAVDLQVVRRATRCRWPIAQAFVFALICCWSMR